MVDRGNYKPQQYEKIRKQLLRTHGNITLLENNTFGI